MLHENLLILTQEVLSGEKSLCSQDGILMKSAVLESAEKMNSNLLSCLLKNEKTKAAFFTDADGMQVFDKVKFCKIVQNKSFLPDSYTAYKNKIGLTDARGSFISSKNDVVLSFPYKDCVLEGGQTKDDQKRKEIFYNETLAPEQITNLLAPKAFCNAKRYDKDGAKDTTKILPTDNLIIKGNNLLALSSLLQNYAGQVKCIYIDPPYNTGSDSFGYNDNFNHSTWLTFMKNRLEIARKLLREDGCIFVHCDNNEQAYLKILLDEIFGRTQFIETITVVNNPRGRDYGGIANMHEFIQVYVKNINNYEFNRLPDPNKNFPFYDSISGYEVRELRNRNTAFTIENRPNLCYPFYVNPHKEVDNGFLELSLVPKDGFEKVLPAKSMGKQTVWRWGKDKSEKNLNVNIVGKAMKEKGKYMIVEKYRESSQMARSVWWDKEVNSERGTIHLREMFGEKTFMFPKPEETLQRIIEISTAPGDLVLDYHLGSGTTAAVAHKMGRKYIGIEQMDYIESVCVERLKKVIAGEQGGISKAQNWQGGGSFVYMELAKQNQNFADKIASCKNDEEIVSLTKEILKSDFVSTKVNPKDISTSSNDYAALSFDDKKKFALELLDKNALYVNASDIDDQSLPLTSADREFTNNFYGKAE